MSLLLAIFLLMGLPMRVLRWQSEIEQVSQEVGLSPQVLACVILHESRGNPDAVSPFGAVGLMQVVPMRGRPSRGELFEPLTNLRTGAGYLKWLIKRNNGNLYQALLDYNGGPYREYTKPTTRKYARRVCECVASQQTYEAPELAQS